MDYNHIEAIRHQIKLREFKRRIQADANIDPNVKDAASDWLDGQIAEIDEERRNSHRARATVSVKNAFRLDYSVTPIIPDSTKNEKGNVAI